MQSESELSSEFLNFLNDSDANIVMQFVAGLSTATGRVRVFSSSYYTYVTVQAVGRRKTCCCRFAMGCATLPAIMHEIAVRVHLSRATTMR